MKKLTLAKLPLTGRLVLASALIFLAPLTTALTSDWVLEREDNGVKVYLRSIETSAYPEVKTEATINASMQAVVRAFGDGSSCAKWQKVCKSSRVIKQISEHEKLVYLVLDLPWPLSDRDLVSYSRQSISDDKKTISVVLTSASEQHPAQDYVRAHSRGQFTIQYISPNSVQFTWITHTNLGGSLSPDMVTPRLAASVLDDVKRLIKLAES